MLVVSVKGSRIYVYDTTTWTNVANYPGGDAIAISPTSQELAKTKSGQDNTVELGDILVGDSRIVLPGHAGLIYCIAYSPDGDHIATASTDATIRIWSTLSGATLHSFGGHTSTVTGVAFSRTGFHLASCSFDKTVRTWDVQTGESLRILEGHTDAAETVIYSPNGSQIASGGADDTIRLWDANTGELCHTLTGHLSTVYGVAYSPDERRIASSSEDGTVRIWDSRTGEPLTTLSGHIVGVTSLEYSPAGDFIASGAWDGTVRLWKTGGDLLLLSDAYLDNDTDAGICFNISPDGERIFTGNEEGTVRILDASTGEPGQEWDLRKRGIEQIAVSPCGGKIACPSLDCTVRVWCASTGASLQILRGHGEPTLDVAFSPSGSHIASGGKDRTVRVWSTESGGEAEVVMCGHSDNVNGVAYSPSGDRIASCSSDKTVRLWDSRTGEQLFVLDHCVELLHVTYSPGGQELAVVPLGSDQISFWDSKLGDHIVDQYKDISQQGIACAFSPIASGDSLLAVASRDGMLRIWDIASGGCTEVLRTLVGLVIEIKWRQTSSEDSGLSLATLGATGSMRVWRLVKAGEERSYVLQLVWGTGERQLMAIDANLEDIVGLSPVNLKLLKQRCEG
ncbi:MAG: WD40-repeat-containing domain protein [Linnemannia elongata]|nr:MAG: WD40-repeat-containing domain protein [Linnemannia elongata]